MAFVPSQPLPESGSTRRPRVLVVDDDPPVARGLARLLRPDHDVSTADQPAEALGRLVSGERFDVVLCDLRMPGLSGADLYLALVRMDPDVASRVIIVTAGAVTQREREFVQEVAPVVLLKPVNVAQIRAAVASLLARVGLRA